MTTNDNEAVLKEVEASIATRTAELEEIEATIARRERRLADVESKIKTQNKRNRELEQMHVAELRNQNNRLHNIEQKIEDGVVIYRGTDKYTFNMLLVDLELHIRFAMSRIETDENYGSYFDRQILLNAYKQKEEIINNIRTANGFKLLDKRRS